MLTLAEFNSKLGNAVLEITNSEFKMKNFKTN